MGQRPTLDRGACWAVGRVKQGSGDLRETYSLVPYRVKIDGSTAAAFATKGDALAFVSEKLSMVINRVEIEFSYEEI